jgi:hypothetical protein
MAQNVSEFDALFNPQVETKDAKGSSGDEYQPSAAKGKNNVYQAIIRFVPWYQSPKQSIKEKWVCWLVDPVTEKGRFVDCPSSVGKPSLLQDIYWKLKKSESVLLQKQAEVFSRKHSYASLIQVIKDENNKELEGKILVWKYGVKVWEKINAELKPVIGDPQDPFDIINGKAFALIITKVSGFNNYDQSKFADKRIPLLIPNAEGKLMPIKIDSDRKAIFEWVKTNSPDLAKHEYREWDQETHDYVNHVIVAVTGQASAPSKMSDVNTNVNKSTSPQASQPSGISASNISIEDIGLDLGNTLPNLDLPNMNDLGLGGDLDDILKDS